MMAAPEGVAMVNYEIAEDQRRQLEKLGIKVSERGKLWWLRDECARQKLSQAAYSCLVWGVVALGDFERNEKPRIKTEFDRLKSIRAVEKAAKTLQDAVHNLSFGDQIGLSTLLVDSSFPISPACTGEGESLTTRADTVELTAFAAAVAAAGLHGELVSKGANGKGRKRTRDAYAGHIAALAHHLMPYGIKPSENGPFSRLCDAVFHAAGLDGEREGRSAGAIRHFVRTMRKDYRARDLCL